MSMKTFYVYRLIHFATDTYQRLATIQCEQILRNNKTILSRDDILVAKKFLRNQTQSTKKDYHFGTSGHIFGFGYGPVYKSNEETKYTIDRFAKSKYIKNLSIS